MTDDADEIKVPLTRAASAALRRMAAAEMRSLENAAAKALTDYLRANGYFEKGPRAKKRADAPGGDG